MTQREVNKMSPVARGAALVRAVEALDRRLNLYGVDEAPLSGLLDEDASHAQVEDRLGKIMTPDCRHRRGACECNFPGWFIREAEKSAREFLVLHRQVTIANAKGGKQ